MKKGSKRIWVIGTILFLIVGSILGYFVGIQEDFSEKAFANNPSPGEGQVPAAEDQFIVKYKDSVSESEEQKIESQEKVSQKTEIKGIDSEILTVPADKDSHEMVSEFRTKFADKIEYAELDTQLSPLYIPNDPGYSNQWGLPKIEAPSGWDITKGSNTVTIAVLDTGVNVNHTDLKNKLVPGWNVVDNNTDLTDLHGHGTLMMGIAGAQTGNSAGMAGVGIEPKIMMMRISNNSYGWAYTSDMAEAVIYATDHGAKVISISFGGTSSSATMQNAINYAYNKGVFVTAAAGNSGTNTLTYPAAYDHVVAVGATNNTDQKASWSNWGPWVDVTSPGVSIYSTNRDGNYSYVSGTSPATPYVAGLASLLLSKNPTLSPSQIENYIKQNSDDLGSAGKDDIYGYGRININKTLTALVGREQAPPLYGTINGKVANEKDKSPIIGAKVTVLQGGTTKNQALTSADGAYSIANLAAGSYNIIVSAAGFEENTQQSVSVSAGQTITINFNLKPIIKNGSISGAVLNYTNKPIKNVTVQLKLLSTPRRDIAGIKKNTRTDSNGRFTFDNLPEGAYYVRAIWRTQFAHTEAIVLGGSTTSVNLKLSRPNPLRWFKKLIKGW